MVAVGGDMEDGKVKEVTSMEGLKTSPAENTGIGARKSPALAPLTKVTASRTAYIVSVIYMSSRAHGARTEGRENKSKSKGSTDESRLGASVGSTAVEPP